MKILKRELFDLLNIIGPSGKEKTVAAYIKKRLHGICDNVFYDKYGNLLAEKIVGNGIGPTILLSAHMDTVKNLPANRKVLEYQGIFYTNKGILGADDRAGIACVLAILRNLDKSGFVGKLKIAFSREEEIGCIGSNHISPKWLKDVKLAIVFDRRGNRDIVVGCGAQPFCSEEVGAFFEEIGEMCDMKGWSAVSGGISDAAVFSGDNKINSVNLSVGFENEHSEHEICEIQSCKDTVQLTLQSLSVVNHHIHSFGKIPTTNYKYDTSLRMRGGFGWDYYDDYEYIDCLLEDMPDNEAIHFDYEELPPSQDSVFYSKTNRLGGVVGQTWNGNVIISEYDAGENIGQVLMSRQEFEELIKNYQEQKEKALPIGLDIGGSA